MPAAEIRRRGGIVRVRTQRLPDDRYRRIYIVRDAGPRGGHTVAGEVQESRTKQAASTRVRGDTQPTYKMKPRTKEIARAVRRR